MGPVKTDEVKEIAVKLGILYPQSPMDYAYLKGWIYCLLHKQDEQLRRRGENNGKKK